MRQLRLSAAALLLTCCACAENSASLTFDRATYPAAGCSAPVVLRMPQPSRFLDQSYWVDLWVTIRIDGNVFMQPRDATVSPNIAGSGWDSDYMTTALDVVRYSTFSPAVCDGRPIEIQGVLRFTSNLAPHPASTPLVVFQKKGVDWSREAIEANFKGTIRASVTVNARGYLESVTVLDSPPFGLGTQIIKSLCDWRFRPATKDGVPVSSTWVVTFTLDRR
ncbi:MAG: energy transducer TonB [Bryobacteraceae bacterium]